MLINLIIALHARTLFQVVLMYVAPTLLACVVCILSNLGSGSSRQPSTRTRRRESRIIYVLPSPLTYTNPLTGGASVFNFSGNKIGVCRESNRYQAVLWHSPHTLHLSPSTWGTIGNYSAHFENRIMFSAELATYVRRARQAAACSFNNKQFHRQNLRLVEALLYESQWNYCIRTT